MFADRVECILAETKLKLMKSYLDLNGLSAAEFCRDPGNLNSSWVFVYIESYAGPRTIFDSRLILRTNVNSCPEFDYITLFKHSGDIWDNFDLVDIKICSDTDSCSGALFPGRGTTDYYKIIKKDYFYNLATELRELNFVTHLELFSNKHLVNRAII